MSFKTALSHVGNAIGSTATVLHNSGINTQIAEIDLEVEDLETKLAELKDRRSDLEGRLIKY